MQDYLNESFREGVNTLISILQEVAMTTCYVLVPLAYLKIINDLRNSAAPNPLIVVGKFLKPTILFLLILSYSQWTDLTLKLIFSVSDYVEGSYQERISSDRRFTNEKGETIDPWLHYHNLLVKARAKENTKLGNIQSEWEKLSPDQQEARNDEFWQKLEAEAESQPSWIGQQISSSLIQFFDWLMEGAYFVILLILEKFQEGLIAILLAIGIMAIMISFIPGREQSLDTFLTYLMSIALWSLLLTVVKVFYNASLNGEILKLEAMVNGSGNTVDYMEVVIEYVANAIVIIMLYLMIPVMVGFIMVKSSGSEVFSKMIGLGSAGTAAAMSYGKMAGGAITSPTGIVRSTASNIASGAQSIGGALQNLAKRN